MSTDSVCDNGVTIVYDGECPFCRSYVRLVRLRQTAGRVDLIDARSSHPVAKELKELGFDLDEGMLVRIGEQTYHGAEAMRILTVLSTPSGLFNRIMRALFLSSARASRLYPVLRSGRNLTLRLLGRKKIADG